MPARARLQISGTHTVKTGEGQRTTHIFVDRHLRPIPQQVNVCCVPFCSSRSNRERSLSYYGLPLKNKSLLKQWIHVIGRANLPVNTSTRICSRHFVNAEGRRLYAGEVPSKHLPSRPTQSSASKKRKPPRERSVVEKSLSLVQ